MTKVRPPRARLCQLTGEAGEPDRNGSLGCAAPLKTPSFCAANAWSSTVRAGLTPGMPASDTSSTPTR